MTPVFGRFAFGRINSPYGELEGDLEIVRSDREQLRAGKEDLRTAYNDLYIELLELTRRDKGVIPPDLDVSGRVLVANPEWNFVVIDKGKRAALKPNFLLLVHRDTEPVGKIRIRKVEEDLAIAEIVQAWEDRQLDAGDEFISPKAPST